MAKLKEARNGVAITISFALAISIFFRALMSTDSRSYAQTIPPGSNCDNVTQPFQTDPKTYTLNVEGKSYKLLDNRFIASIIPHSQNSSLGMTLQPIASDCLVM